MRCYPKKLYYVSSNKIIRLSDGWCNFIRTPSLSRAKLAAKRLKLKYRQIDVREKGKKPFVLHNSWL